MAKSQRCSSESAKKKKKKHAILKITLNLPEYWRVAPKIESIKLPKNPATALIGITGHCGGASNKDFASAV